MEYRSDDSPDVSNIELDFGEVEVGMTIIKSIKIVNQSCIAQSYVVQKDVLSNPLDCAFGVMEYTWSLMPCESYVCDISYKPMFPNKKYTDYYYIVDTNNCCFKVVVRGTSLGSDVSASVTRLVMVCESMQYKRQKCFKLTNHAKVCAKFMFDIDITQCPFKINEPNGVIKASSSKSFTVYFEPTTVGIFKYNLTCLVIHQPPIIIELYGIQSNSSPESVKAFNSRVEMIEALNTEDNFASYMLDATDVVRSDPPLILLSHNCIDFGQAKTGSENYGKRTPRTVTLTNDNLFNLLVVWDEDVTKTFSIQPREAKVRANQSIIFEVRFDPAKENTLFSRELLARAFRIPCCETNDNEMKVLQSIAVPDYVSLRLIGHSYCFGMNDCVPHYEIPETVIMPACVPTEPAYSTFAIKNFGQQPLMFCFVPPNKSHYSVKPMMGLIGHKQEHQLIVVQLFPKAEGDHAYVERWALRLNGNPEYEICIDLQGYAEQANLIFNNNNCVNLDPVHIHCLHSQSVLVRNPTRHCVRYEYSTSDFPTELSIRETTGIIHPNEMVSHDWIYAPDKLGDSNFGISCYLSSGISNKSIAVHIEVSGKCSEGSLIAIPEELNFGERAYGELCESELKIFNFSSVTINFSLICRPSKTMEIMDRPENDIKVTPMHGAILPGKGEKVQVAVNPKQPGFYELNIDYCIKSHPAAEESISLIQPKSLCTLNCMCHLPTLQIQDLLYRAETNKQVTKLSLWKSLNIDELNSILETLMPSYETSVEMIVPFVSLKENEKFVVKLMVKNVKPINAAWFFKKQTTCLCNDQSRAIGLKMKSANNRCSYCVQDEACKIYPTKMMLSAGDTGILTIVVSNDTLHPCGIFWDVNIQNERYIKLNIRLENQMLLYGECLTFKQINLKQRRMRYQTVWLYNDKECEALYSVDTKNITELNKKSFGEVFTCLNPEGSVKGLTRQPIIFGFCPNRIRTFQTSAVVTLFDTASTLHIEADSTFDTIRETEKCPFSDIFRTPEIEIYFNHDCVIASPISIHGRMTKIIMVHNHNCQDVFEYKWTDCEIPGLAKVTVQPISGLIQPQTLLTFIVEIQVGSYECCLDVDLFCDFINVSERRIAEKMKSEEERIMCQMENEFTITEKGLLPPDDPIFEEIKEPSTFCKALTLKICTYDFEYIADNKIDLNHELKNTPDEEVRTTTLSYKDKSISSRVAKMSSHIFENIIWNIISSDSFSKTLRENLNNIHNLKYSQLPIDTIKRSYLSERTKLIPAKRNVEDILLKMISMIVHDEFNFDASHFSHPPDVRQICYQKIYTEDHYIDRQHYYYQK